MIMNLSNETIKALSLFISGGGCLKPSQFYKSGSKLVEFFNKINSTCERYLEAMNSCSRIPYTQNELAKINGTDKMY